MDEATFLRFVVDVRLSSVISLIIRNDLSLVPKNHLHELGAIQESLFKILTVLEDAEDTHKQRLWLKKIKKVAYEAEDVIDILLSKVTELNPWFKYLPFLRLFMNVNLALSLKHVNDSLQKIKNEGLLFLSLRDISGDWRIPHIDVDLVITNSKIMLDNPAFSRQADASKIVNLLSLSSDHRVLTVVPILGMSGLGKTALAKLVCQQAMALDLFDVKMWVSVSKQWDELKLLGQMLRSLNPTMGVLSLTDKETILQQLEKELARKRFLLVLDNVWNDVSRWWGHLKTRLLKLCANNGNVVLVTTPSKQVASIVETSSKHRHKVEFLSNDECWFILKERAFRNATPQVQSYLEDIGREIANKCRGVALAAKVLGGTLGFTKNKAKWMKIRDSLVSNAKDNEGNLESILKLSFDLLPLPLKPCLVFCSIFPKGFLIIKEDLVQLWVVERFANSYGQGNKYFHALLANSFFQDVESDVDGNVIKCKMHNLVHDLALSSLEKSEMCIHYLYEDYQSITTSEPYPNKKTEYLTTIILNDAPFQSSWNLKRLRTLYLNDVDMEIVPTSINKLKHFRYLHISNTKTRPLPKSITAIYLLQTLVLSNCSCEQLPLLGVLPFLTFLKISHMKRVKCIGDESYEGTSSRRVSKLFPSLQSLSLSWMENLTEWSPPSHGNKVVMFPFLENLSIQCCPKLTCFPMRDLSVLVKIEIKDCEELRFPFDEHKLFSSCPFTEIYLLRTLVLSNCSCEQLPLLGVLPFLTFLKISHMERVKCIRDESYEGPRSRHVLKLFPSLQSLSLSWMENLTEWSPPSHGNKVVIFPLLENLSIQCCPKLTCFPMRDLSVVVKIEIKDCEELRFPFDEHKPFSFPSITSLSIVGCPKLTHLRNLLLSNKSYKEFRVRRCEWLRFISDDLGMQRSLVSLQIYCCKGLGFFSEDVLCKLTQLRKLTVGAFSEKLDDFCYLNKIKDLTQLEELEIWGSDVFGRKMYALPNQIQHLSSLRSLKIKGFTAMEALPKWLGDLQRLETISLNHWWNLEPKSTAEIMQRLSNLSQDSFYGCHALKEHKSQWMEFSSGRKINILFH